MDGLKEYVFEIPSGQNSTFEDDLFDSGFCYTVRDSDVSGMVEYTLICSHVAMGNFRKKYTIKMRAVKETSKKSNNARESSVGVRESNADKRRGSNMIKNADYNSQWSLADTSQGIMAGSKASIEKMNRDLSYNKPRNQRKQSQYQPATNVSVSTIERNMNLGTSSKNGYQNGVRGSNPNLNSVHYKPVRDSHTNGSNGFKYEANSQTVPVRDSNVSCRTDGNNVQQNFQPMSGTHGVAYGYEADKSNVASTSYSRPGAASIDSGVSSTDTSNINAFGKGGVMGKIDYGYANGSNYLSKTGFSSDAKIYSWHEQKTIKKLRQEATRIKMSCPDAPDDKVNMLESFIQEFIHPIPQTEWLIRQCPASVLDKAFEHAVSLCGTFARYIKPNGDLQSIKNTAEKRMINVMAFGYFHFLTVNNIPIPMDQYRTINMSTDKFVGDYVRRLKMRLHSLHFVLNPQQQPMSPRMTPQTQSPAPANWQNQHYQHQPNQHYQQQHHYPVHYANQPVYVPVQGYPNYPPLAQAQVNAQMYYQDPHTVYVQPQPSLQQSSVSQPTKVEDKPIEKPDVGPVPPITNAKDNRYESKSMPEIGRWGDEDDIEDLDNKSTHSDSVGGYPYNAVQIPGTNDVITPPLQKEIMAGTREAIERQRSEEEEFMKSRASRISDEDFPELIPSLQVGSEIPTLRVEPREI